MVELNDIHQEILRILEEHHSTYARPVRSEDIGLALNVSPSYVREKASVLQNLGLIRARRGRGGGRANRRLPA